MFNKILIANRGEIACRVIRTCRQLGIATVAVYSEADANAQHVLQADEAWLLGPAPARESYLRAERIIDIARQSGAQAIHPGYGFLSENEDFAAAVAAAGLVFIGPPAGAIAAMGSKSAAKRLMEQAQVPLVPGYHGLDQDPATLQQAADSIGYPVLIKASAGGGGKGMKVAESSADFANQLASAKREAQASFGDDQVLVEKYLTQPRHIEIQVFADSHGNCVYLFERDCSVQRRHQKVLEEAPAPGLSQQQREMMGNAAVNAAKAIGYVGAGTVEFIFDTLSGQFYFMEMNTRLQVEHPVTETITGQDLVEWQLRVASGEPLPLAQEQLAINGHAIEVRIYAEDPDKDFLPAIGHIRHLRLPPQTAQVRIDSGIVAGDEISPYYDPMIAKLIVHGANRQQALQRMAQALAQYRIVGLTTNLDFLQRLVAHPAFAAFDVDTRFISRFRDDLLPAAATPPASAIAALLLDSLLQQQAAAEQRRLASSEPNSPWHSSSGWRLNEPYHQTFHLLSGEQRHSLNVGFATSGYQSEWQGQPLLFSGQRLPNGQLRLQLNGRQFNAEVISLGHERHVYVDGQHWPLAIHDPVLDGLEHSESNHNLTAPMPGTVVAVLVQAGDTVEPGQPLMVLEAMKMEHSVVAAAKGKVAEILYAVGERVAEGVELLRLEDGE